MGIFLVTSTSPDSFSYFSYPQREMSTAKRQNVALKNASISGSFLQKAFESFKERNEERKTYLLSKFEKARFNSDFDKTMAYNLVKSQFGRLYKCSDFETVSSISNELSKDRGNIEAKRRYMI